MEAYQRQKAEEEKKRRPQAAHSLSRAGHSRRAVSDGGLFRHSVHRQVAHGLYPDGYEHAQPPVAGNSFHTAQRHRQGCRRNGGRARGADRRQQ